MVAWVSVVLGWAAWLVTGMSQRSGRTSAVGLRGRFRTARAQRAHNARTAPVITVFTPVTALKTCHLEKHA